MTLKELLKKKDKVAESSTVAPPPPHVSEFTFVRSTTTTEEVIAPPSFASDDYAKNPPTLTPLKSKEKDKGKHRFSFRRSSKDHGKPLVGSPPNEDHESRLGPEDEDDTSTKKNRRISHRLEKMHLGGSHSRSASRASSSNVPTDMPDAPPAVLGQDDNNHNQESVEAEWEKRATLLAQGQSVRSRSASVASATGAQSAPGLTANGSNKGAGAFRPGHQRRISGMEEDVNIQEAIRLHEAGDLDRSTAMFAALADPNGENNALAQVLYGLALRHGWGTTANPQAAVTYLSTALSNSADVERAALDAGMAKGGAAKGELVLAVYELGNSFRHGWGVDRDPVAARMYYETAANLGDVDAMGEIAWCYLEGFGGKKDKFKASQYLRRAEVGGKKEIGNTWIWKDKYNPK